MKALSITGLVIGLLSFLAAMYLQFVLAPAAASLEASLNTGFSDEMTSMMWMAAHEAKVNMGETLVISSGLALILSVIPAIKTKSKMAMVGTMLSLISLLIGIIQGTHMFS